MEQIINEIIQKYFFTIILSFASIIATGLILLSLKNFISNLLNYIIVRMSDLGYGAMILWDGKLKRVIEIKFKRIKVIDNEEIQFIPIKTWIASVQTYPQPRFDTFDEKKWKESPWDGKTERRRRNENITIKTENGKA